LIYIIYILTGGLKKMKNKLYYLTILAASLFLAGCAKTAVAPSISPQASIQEESVIKATFNCSDNKTIQAEFGKDKVKLTLSDGRVWDLPIAMSGSGARYANSDETQVFWNKGDTAFIEENGQTTFADCVVQNN